MTKQKPNLTEAQMLRKKAEDLYKTKISVGSTISDESDILKLNHELSVHQIELEIQNSELIKAKDDLEVAVEKYIDLYDFAPTGYLTLSRDGEIIRLNLCASKMLGKERSRLIKNRFGAFVTDNTKQEFNHFLTEIFISQIEQSCEVTMLGKGEFPIYVYLIGIATKDGISCDISMVDISERKNAEEKLAETNHELERSIQLNADKDLFISVLAHDLRNPFGVLIGFTDILLKDGKKLSEKEYNDLLGEISRSALNSYNLLEDLLKWSRIRMGRIPFEPLELSFTDICIDIISSLSQIAKAKGITIRCNVEKEINVVADREMLKAVFRNLVSNAIKFTNTNGQIKVSALQSNSSVLFSVSDNGVGMESERLIKLFDISHSHSTMGTANEKGTGLGLLLCKDFVEKHGGKIWVESEVGKGTVFYFDIPSHQSLKAIADLVNTSESNHNLKVLITDDNAGLRIILGAMMQDYSREILYAETGVEAVTVCASNPDIDLILMDISMPKMDGLEATKLIRMINKKVVIIIETAKSLSEITEETKGKEINDYFFKPYSRSFLDGLISKHFNNRKT